MYLIKTLALAATFFQTALTATPASATAAGPGDLECGGLGIMHIDNLPEGVNANNTRKCLQHPEGILTDKSLHQRKCAPYAKLGCSHNGYCWRQCTGNGDGSWCFTAKEKGYGDWIRCSTWQDCVDMSAPCGAGKCEDCGCSC